MKIELFKSVFNIAWATIVAGILKILHINEDLTIIMLVAFWLDLWLGMIKAIKYNNWGSSWINKWLIKWFSYWIYLFMWYGLMTITWQVLFYNFFLWVMILRDFTSILENLKEVWIKVPPVLLNTFTVYKKKFITSKVELITWEKFLKYEDDFSSILTTYIPKFKNEEYKKFFERDIKWIENIAKEIRTNTSWDCENLKLQLLILLDDETNDLKNRIEYSNALNIFKDKYLDGHNLAVAEIKEEIGIDIPNDNFEMAKNLLISMLLRWMIRWIWAWLNSERNLKYEHYKKGCIWDCEKCTLEVCTRTWLPKQKIWIDK